MKIIVQKPENIAVYALDDQTPVTLLPNSVVIGTPVVINVAFLTAANTTVYENVTAPGDFIEMRYLFDGETWTPNPDWVDPTPAPAQG